MHGPTLSPEMACPVVAEGLEFPICMVGWMTSSAEAARLGISNVYAGWVETLPTHKDH